MSDEESKKTDTQDKLVQKELKWFHTKGLNYVFEELVPEAVDVLKLEQYIPVLVTGPSGVGKTYICERIIETAGIQKDEVLRINCAAFAEGLIESEIFGHVKGAFTDAKELNPGMVGANGKELWLLEEIGTLAKHVQAKLLVFLETGEYRKVGSNTVEKVKKKLRIIGVTNSPPNSNDFREDFLFRFHVIAIPALHLRRHDIPELLQNFIPDFHWTNLDALRLMCYNWPGNVRQLRRFAYLVKRYRDKIRGSSLSVVEWFDRRFSRVFDTIHRGPDTPGVPHMKGLEHFYDLPPSEEELWKEIGIKVKEFSVFSEPNKNTDKFPFNSDDLEEAWHRWCYIVHQDKFADTDIWECLIKRKQTSFTDPREGALIHDERPYEEIEELASKFSRQWYGDSRSTTENNPQAYYQSGLYQTTNSKSSPDQSQDKLQEITLDQALQMVLENYGPKQYKDVWENHCSKMSSKEVADKYNLNPKSVRQTRWRDKSGKSESPENNEKTTE